MTPLSKWIPANWKEGGAAPKRNDGSTGMPLVVTSEPIVYRNFIAGAGNRGIGVGYPGGVNIAWNAETMNLAVVWRGAFIDAARHWTDRGGGAQSPLGYDVFHPLSDTAPAFAVLASPDAEWPQPAKNQRLTDFQWKGYELDAKRYPTFSYEWRGVKIAERYDPEGDSASGSGKLIRSFHLTGPIPPGAMLRIASGGSIQPSEGAFLVDGGTRFIVSAPGALLAGKNLLVPATENIKVTYSWLPMHAGHSAAR